MLIDTGYEAEMLELKAYLDTKQICIEKIIISHYHEDTEVIRSGLTRRKDIPTAACIR